MGVFIFSFVCTKLDIFYLKRIAALTCAGGRESKRSLFARLPVSGQAPCSGAERRHKALDEVSTAIPGDGVAGNVEFTGPRCLRVQWNGWFALYFFQIKNSAFWVQPIASISILLSKAGSFCKCINSSLLFVTPWGITQPLPSPCKTQKTSSSKGPLSLVWISIF
jgi:hypothetical protein